MKTQTNEEKSEIWKEAGGDHTKVQCWESSTLGWLNCRNVHSTYNNYRLKPHSVTINGVEVYPVKEVAPQGTYYVLSPALDLGYDEIIGWQINTDSLLIARNYVFATEEHAQQAAKALGWVE